MHIHDIYVDRSDDTKVKIVKLSKGFVTFEYVDIQDSKGNNYTDSEAEWIFERKYQPEVIAHG